MKDIFIFLGPPGSGKGTQAQLLSESKRIPHISTGDMLRKFMKEGSELGKKVKKIVDSGALVSDEIMIELIEDRIKKTDCEKGFILDGFPRTMPQARALKDLFEKENLAISAVILFEISADALFYRLESRREKDNRADDSAETQLERLKVYEEATEPLIKFYEGYGILKRVDANADIEDVSQRVVQVLDDI